MEPPPTQPALQPASSAEDEEEMLRQIAEQEHLADAESAPPPEKDDESYKREVIYRVSPNGLRIQIEGAEFRPSAEVIRVGGGYGLKLSVEASCTAPRVLLNPKHGPLAFGGTVHRQAEEKFGDTRQGDSELKLTPQTPKIFTRTWPEPGHKPLMEGEQLDLEVGLWGLGVETVDRRPVRKFFQVKLTTANADPVLRIDPPSR